MKYEDVIQTVKWGIVVGILIGITMCIVFGVFQVGS